MERSCWRKEYHNYFSDHLLITYLGDQLPKYTVLENPDGQGWLIGIFFSFIGGYAPLEEEGEKRLIFQTAEDAQRYVDKNLK